MVNLQNKSVTKSQFCKSANSQPEVDKPNGTAYLSYMNTQPHVRFLDRTTPPHISTLILMTGLSAMNMSIFLPSLNAMADYFDTTYAVMQLSLSGYLAATAILQVIVGPISDRFGRRPVILTGIGIFIFASLGALFSPNVETFLFFRLLQACVATSMALSRAIVRDMVSQDQAASTIGYITMGMALVPMVGPMIGGLLDQLFNWQATFVFLIIVGCAVFMICFLDQGETVAGEGMPFSQQVKTYPELLRSPRFWGYTMCATFSSGAFFALLGGTSFVASTVFGLSPIWSGAAIGVPAAGYLVGNFFTARFAVRIGVNKLALIGACLLAFGMGSSLLLSLLGVSNPLVFFGFCLFVGLGNGTVLPNTMAGSVSVRPHLAGTASGLSGAIMVGGGAALSAWSGALLTVETGTRPLQWIMFITAILAVASILAVIKRDQRIKA